VEDDGSGIDAVDLPLIFEKFYRGKKGTASRKGTGMGLAIARAILHAHGGGIEVSSTLGYGTTFRFWVREWKRNLQARSKGRSAWLAAPVTLNIAVLCALSTAHSSSRAVRQAATVSTGAGAAPSTASRTPA